MIEWFPYFNTNTLHVEKSYLYCNSEHKIQKINNLLKPEFMSRCGGLHFNKQTEKKKKILFPWYNKTAAMRENISNKMYGSVSLKHKYNLQTNAVGPNFFMIIAPLLHFLNFFFHSI